MLRSLIRLLLISVPAFTLMACGADKSVEKVTVLVEVDRPPGITDEQLTTGFTTAVPLYQSVSGLERKYFTYTGEVFGGIYLWENKAAADAFYTEEWRTRIKQTYGSEVKLTWFDVPVTTPGGSFNVAKSDAVVAIVNVSAPWYAPDGIIRDRMVNAVPLYANVPGLDFKYFTMADNNKVGGVYLWRDKNAANNFYNTDWHKRIRETYGEDADLQFMQAPVTLDNSDAE